MAGVVVGDTAFVVGVVIGDTAFMAGVVLGDIAFMAGVVLGDTAFMAGVVVGDTAFMAGVVVGDTAFMAGDDTTIVTGTLLYGRWRYTHRYSIGRESGFIPIILSGVRKLGLIFP